MIPLIRHHWRLVVATCIILVVLVTLPPTRIIIVYILPLGLKPDDILVMALLVGFGIAVSRGWIGIFDSISESEESHE